jgi:serine/threonine-protein phosphatase 6 regulatory ankyrin repeat subunit B
LKEVEKLIKREADINSTCENNQTSLLVASQNGHTDVVAILLREGADPNIKNRLFDRGSFLIDGRIPIYDNGFNALYWPAIKGYENIVRILIDSGADVNMCDIEGKCALHFAVEKADPNIVRKIIKAKPSLDQQTIIGLTPLDLALKIGNKTIVNMLIKAGCKLSRNNSGIAFNLLK